MSETGKTIALIEALKGSGGGGLPAVTSADNGKVLGVVDGAWAAQNDFVVTLSINPETYPDELDADKSSTEIQTAYLQGKRLVLALPVTEEEVYYAFPELRYTFETEQDTRYSFGAILNAGSFGTYYIQTDSNPGVEVVTAFTLVPAS